MPPPGGDHGAVEGESRSALKVQGEYQGLGKAGVGEVGIVLGRDPDHVFGADALFVDQRPPADPVFAGRLPGDHPRLVVEVRSKNETLAALQRKAEDYLKAGGVVVWVVDPIKRNVVEYRNGVEPQTYPRPTY